MAGVDVSDGAWSVAREIAEPVSGPPHVVLLGAGASKAALPDGDRHGRPVPVMNQLADMLPLPPDVPEEARELLRADFEGGYAELVVRGGAEVEALDTAIFDYMAALELPENPTIYDQMLLSLRAKDVIFTFNWDPFLVQARMRLHRHGVPAGVLPDMYFLHGNVAVGACQDHQTIGPLPGTCRKCGRPYAPTRLLYPIAEKAYWDGGVLQGGWMTAQSGLESAFMLTVYGYSAPKTDVEALRLLEEGWHGPGSRPVECIEIINRPGSDHAALYDAWEFLIFEDHYKIRESFLGSWMARHPRRTFEAYRQQCLLGAWIDDNPVPSTPADLSSLIAWFEPLLAAERGAGLNETRRELLPIV